jgi:hypothetical protein
MKMEQTECSETSAFKIQAPGNYPEENIQHVIVVHCCVAFTSWFLKNVTISVTNRFCNPVRIYGKKTNDIIWCDVMWCDVIWYDMNAKMCVFVYWCSEMYYLITLWVDIGNWKHCSTQNMEKRPAKLYYFEAAEFKNDIEIFNLALVFELKLWFQISLFSTKY